MKRLLIVVDMQNDFTTGVLGNAECEAAIGEVAQVIKSGRYNRIFLTKDTHTEEYMNTQEGSKLPVEHCIRGTKGWDIHEDIKAALKESGVDEAHITVINKPTFGSVALGETMKNYCERHENVEIDICGVCTGICVISNALLLKAFVPEAVVSVIEKACACVTPESHKTAIEAMKNCQVNII